MACFRNSASAVVATSPVCQVLNPALAVLELERKVGAWLDNKIAGTFGPNTTGKPLAYVCSRCMAPFFNC